MYINTTGLILREVMYKDSSKILTILTGSEGKLTVTARGALRRNSKLMSVTQLFAFSQMTLFKRNDRWTLTEAQSIEEFHGLRDDIVLLALGAYFAELTEVTADEDSQSPEILPLCLNALYALSRTVKPPEFIKPAFELRLISVLGFKPLITHCAVCGRDDIDRAFVDITGGTMRCDRCVALTEYSTDAPLSRSALISARYILECERKKLFSFTLGDSALRELSKFTEAYLLTHLGRKFRTLEYYKGLLG